MKTWENILGIGFCVMVMPAMATTSDEALLAGLEGGTIITAHQPTDAGCSNTTCNGRKFYVSNGGVNWWTAFTWCRANGLELASLSEACPPANTGIWSCPNLDGLLPKHTWTNLGSSAYPTRAATVREGGTFDLTSVGKTDNAPRALCTIPLQNPS